MSTLTSNDFEEVVTVILFDSLKYLSDSESTGGDGDSSAFSC